MNSAAGALIAQQAKLIQARIESNAKKLFREKVMCKQKWRFFIRICSGEKWRTEEWYPEKIIITAKDRH